MPTAYVFMNCNTGAEKRVVNELADLDEVLEVRGIYGIYDIYAKVKSKTNEQLNNTIKFRMRIMPDVTSTMVLFVNDWGPGKD
ncbi:MAG: Lrp/AsnC ligand binding domain-containing protein [Nitrososphaeraceae archaeon]